MHSLRARMSECLQAVCDVLPSVSPLYRLCSIQDVVTQSCRIYHFLPPRLPKGEIPTARGSSGHRLFISAFMIASKVICDDTYSNKSWCIVSQNLYTLKEINQMECKMCSYLEWIPSWI